MASGGETDASKALQVDADAHLPPVGVETSSVAEVSAAAPVGPSELPRLDRDDFSLEYIEKYNKYQCDYFRRIWAKYFSKKNFNGDDIFDEEIAIGNEVIRCSRWPCARSYLNPVLNSPDPNSIPSSVAETSLSNRKTLRRT